MQKITPCLWFDDNIEEAVNLYVSLFRNAHIDKVAHYPDGRVLTINFVLDGEEFLALNGGPIFKFTEAVSLSVDCADQTEVDHFWNALIANGGEESQCGWLKDKFGLSWQIVPRALPRYLGDKDRARAGRVMEAMMKMRKIVVADLDAAAAAA